jgi:hypothetical protein
MGPWVHKVDDGLDARKTAYETMYTLVCSVDNEATCVFLTSFG